MQNQVCNNCGQENIPSSFKCAKCGQPLGQPPGGGFRAQGSAQQPSGAPDGGKKSNKIFWIIGGVVAVLLIGAFFVVIAAAGLAFYLSNQQETTRREFPAPERSPVTNNGEKKNDPSKEIPDSDDSTNTGSDNPLDDVSFPSGKDITFGDQSSGTMNNKVLLNFFVQKKSKVGRFTLANVKTSTDRSIFPGRRAGVQAEYKRGSRKLTHRVAIYDSLDDAKSDIATYRGMVRKSGAKIRSSAEDRLVFVLRGSVYLAFYNQQGGLHEISSRNGNDLIGYYNSYFGYK